MRTEVQEKTEDIPIREGLANCGKCSKRIIMTEDMRVCPVDATCLCVACSLTRHGKCPQCGETLQSAE